MMVEVYEGSHRKEEDALVISSPLFESLPRKGEYLALPEGKFLVNDVVHTSFGVKLFCSKAPA